MVLFRCRFFCIVLRESTVGSRVCLIKLRLVSCSGFCFWFFRGLRVEDSGFGCDRGDRVGTVLVILSGNNRFRWLERGRFVVGFRGFRVGFGFCFFVVLFIFVIVFGFFGIFEALFF